MAVPSPFADSLPAAPLPLAGALTPEDFDRLLCRAVDLKASDVTLQPNQPVWAEIAGRWVRLTARALRAPEVETVARTIYGDTAMALLNAGRDADPAYEIRHPELGTRLRFRVNMTAGRLGGGTSLQITLRTLPMQPIPIDVLRVEEPILRHFRPAQGLNLVCGPTGAGKSTLLSSLIRWRCEQPGANEKVLEYSKPIEYVFDGLEFPNSFVFQTEAGTQLRPAGEDDETSLWAYCVRNALRRKPSIIVIGEARDRATIQACVEAALTGHLVLTTLHTIGVAETVRRLILPFPPAERETIAADLLQVLNLIVTQMLLPRRGGGRVAVREFMVFTPSLRQRLSRLPAASWPQEIRSVLAREEADAQTLAAAVRRLVDRGEIDEDDAMHLLRSRA